MESKFEKWLNGNAVVLSGIMGLGFLAAGASTVSLLLSEKLSTEASVFGLGFGFLGIALGADALYQAYDFHKNGCSDVTSVQSSKGRSKSSR